MIKIIAVGKVKKDYFSAGIEYYLKQMNIKCELIEIKDEKDIQGMQIEGQKILDKIKKDDHVIVLAIKGMMIDSVELAHKIDHIQTNIKKDIVFVIGGSFGLSESVYQRANEQISISRMTFPHQLVRLMLIEQLYRAEMILKNHPYHK